MSGNSDRVRDLISEQAAEWFVANRAGLSPQQRQSFAAWLKTSPVHVEEYLAHSVIARDLKSACEHSPEALEALLARARSQPEITPPSWWTRITATGTTTARRWQPAALIASTCAAASLGWFASRALWPVLTVPPDAIIETHLATRHGEQKSRLLADHTVLHLNTDSAVTIRYSSQERVVMLTAGEANFEVAHDANRPFRVVAGAAQVIDVGTQFDVRLGRESTRITVSEGKVTVGPARGDGRGVEVGAGREIIVAAGVWPPAQPLAVDPEHATAWLHRQIVFNHEPLDKVASEFNRYAPKPIEIITPGLRSLEISGVFTTDDPAAFIAFLRSLTGVRVEETPTTIRVSRDAG